MTDKFWGWMKEKGRLSTHELSCVSEDSFTINAKGVIYKGSMTSYAKLPKQMLIGYMLEYMIKSDVRVLVASIEEIYYNCKREIEEQND